MARLILHDAAPADGTSGTSRTAISLAIEGGQTLWRVWAVYQRGARVA